MRIRGHRATLDVVNSKTLLKMLDSGVHVMHVRMSPELSEAFERECRRSELTGQQIMHSFIKSYVHSTY